MSEPFLYSADFLPAMMILCSFGFISPVAWICRSAFCVFVTAGSFSNYSTFRYSIDLVHHALTIVPPTPCGL